MRGSTEDLGDKVTGHLLTYPYHHDKAIFCGKEGGMEGGRDGRREGWKRGGVEGGRGRRGRGEEQAE